MIEKQAGEPLGAALTGPVFDRVRTCDNHCPFCFIYQLPAGMRTQPLREGRRLPTLLPLRELHHAHPVHRGRPRARAHRAPLAAVREHPRDGPRPARPAPAQPARRNQPALARRTPRRRCGGARSGRGVPGDQRRPRPRRHPARRARPLPTSRDARRRAPRGERALARARAASSTRAPRPSPCSTPSSAGRRGTSTPSAVGSSSPPTSTTSWPNARFRPPTRTRTSRNTRTASAWRARSSDEIAAALRGDADADVVGTAPRAGFFASVEGAPAAGYRAAARDARVRRSTRAPSRARRHRHRRVRRARARAAAPDARGCGRRPRPAAAGGEPVLRRQHRGHRAPHRRRRVRRARTRAARPPLPPARRRALRRPLPRRRPRRRPPACRSRSSAPTGADLVRPSDEHSDEHARDATRGGHRRPTQRRQVDAGQPHRRQPPRDRRGEARRHA